MFVGMFLAIMVFSPPMVFAQQEPEPAVLPDSFFYNFKLAVENFQEFITTQDERKAELLLKQVEERDREAEALERMGKFIPIERLKAIQAEKIAKAEQIILRLENTLSFAHQLDLLLLITQMCQLFRNMILKLLDCLLDYLIDLQEIFSYQNLFPNVVRRILLLFL